MQVMPFMTMYLDLPSVASTSQGIRLITYTARKNCYLDKVFVIPVAVMSTTNVTDMPRGITTHVTDMHAFGITTYICD